MNSKNLFTKTMITFNFFVPIKAEWSAQDVDEDSEVL